MVTVGMDDDGLPALAHAAALTPTGDRTPGDRDAGIECLDPQPPARIAFDFQDWIRDREAVLARRTGTQRIGDREQAILVSVTSGRSARDLEVHIAELRELAHSAGVGITDVVTQNRPRVDPKTVLGSGKLDELVIRAFQSDVDLVIVDQDLTPTQARNLGERMGLRVIDRTRLILDIFAQHATTRDGKLQVELAQLKYLLPRLVQRAEVSLSRLAGGIGGRGPGETKLQVDRRRTRDRLTRLERELKMLAAQRENRRQRRGRRAVPVLSIVGYTNAGKSTLLRVLTRTEMHVADQMFATLDPTSRRLRSPREREVIITDTVGFIRDLPADLVAAFRATLRSWPTRRCSSTSSTPPHPTTSGASRPSAECCKTSAWRRRSSSSSTRSTEWGTARGMRWRASTVASRSPSSAAPACAGCWRGPKPCSGRTARVLRTAGTDVRIGDSVVAVEATGWQRGSAVEECYGAVACRVHRGDRSTAGERDARSAAGGSDLAAPASAPGSAATPAKPGWRRVVVRIG